MSEETTTVGVRPTLVKATLEAIVEHTDNHAEMIAHAALIWLVLEREFGVENLDHIRKEFQPIADEIFASVIDELELPEREGEPDKGQAQEATPDGPQKFYYTVLLMEDEGMRDEDQPPSEWVKRFFIEVESEDQAVIIEAARQEMADLFNWQGEYTPEELRQLLDAQEPVAIYAGHHTDELVS
ncbi:hypothetical protein [Thalassobius sp. Cn5-15]|uniref:hypothetical protein n=1 Tax=Thalassobius sp. Cn5-15 TaxID=2917763 RepID=UPI001EF1C194|nr:hypothetical protein [Thalassobius sp. Cn5-15]MCG7492435.1 hypothetical protein [Thalassobius sp. Cn5-15]